MTSNAVAPSSPLGLAEFSVVASPAPEISVALVGPAVESSSCTFRMCMAVAAHGLEISVVRVILSDETDVCAFWKRVVLLQNSCKAQPFGVVPFMPMDSWQGVGSLAHWSCAKPTKRLESQLSAGLANVAEFLHPDFSRLLVRRPALRLSLSGRLLRLALDHGNQALSYALQSLDTEPSGLLHFAVVTLPDSARIRDAIFRGDSLPAALAALGVKKSLVRRARNSRGGAFAPQNSDIEGDHRAGAWIDRMRRLSGRMPDWILDAPDFTKLYAKIEGLRLEESRDVSDISDLELAIFRHCLRPGYGVESFQRVVSSAANMEKRSYQVLGASLTRQEALALALNCPIECGTDTTALNRFLDPALKTDLLDKILKLHPRAPVGLAIDMLQPYFIAPLDSTESLLAHGENLQICLAQLGTIFNYVCDGSVIYGVLSGAGASVGTLTFKFQKIGRLQKVKLAEISGSANAQASVDLQKISVLVEEGLNSPSSRLKFRSYFENCDKLLAFETKKLAARILELQQSGVGE
jgi:hypothetical protein